MRVNKSGLTFRQEAISSCKRSLWTAPVCWAAKNVDRSNELGDVAIVTLVSAVAKQVLLENLSQPRLDTHRKI